MQGFDHRLAADTPQADVEALLARAQRRPARVGHPAPAPDAGAHRRQRPDLADRPRQGRRRAHAGLRRPAREGPPGPAPVHARRAAWSCSTATTSSSRAPRRSSSAARTSSASRSPRCCSPRNATVTVCHSRTRDLPAVCRRADVLVAAVGRPRMVQGDWVKPGATVIDVGINRTDDGLVGDVDFDAAAERAARITPVPARRRPDDDRDAAAQHAARRRRRRRAGMSGGCAPASGSRPRGAVALIASLFLHWYGTATGGGEPTAWQAFGVLDVVLVLLALVPSRSSPPRRRARARRSRSSSA